MNLNARKVVSIRETTFLAFKKVNILYFNAA